MIKDYIRFAFQSLKKRQTRSWLTMIGIFIGIALLVALVGLGQGLQVSVEHEFEKLGADKIFIQAKGGFAAPGSSIQTVSLTKDDVKAVKATNGVMDAVAYNIKSAKVEYNGVIKYPYVASVTFESDLFSEMMESFADIGQGQELQAGDDGKVLLGYLYSTEDVFGKALKVNDRIRINDEPFRIIGFYESVGNRADDMNVYITSGSFEDLYGKSDDVSQIMAKLDKNVNLDTVTERIEKSLRKSRNVEEGKEDFEVSTAEDLMASFGDILIIVQAFLMALAAISLIVGAVGITNTMYTAVLERTKEIGIMKAIGARNATIRLIFIIESGMLGIAGGAIGILLGMGVGKLAELVIHAAGFSILKVYFSWYLIFGALVFSWFVGTLAGLTPAVQASKQKPVDALRYE